MRPSVRNLAIVFAVVLVAGTAGVLVSRGETPKGLGPHDRPSIVLILTDDQRWDTLWAMPEVRRLLVHHGVTFSNAFVVNSLCCPSRSSILTGDYSHTTGVYRNSGTHGGFASFDGQSTIATWLDAAGYDTALVGKYLNGTPGGYVPPGWDTWNAIVMSPSLGDYYYDWVMTIGTEVQGFGHDPGDYSTNVLADRAVDFVHSAQGPLFLYFAPWAPHRVAVPAPGDEHAFSHLKPFRPPGFDERDVSDKPGYVRGIPRFDGGVLRHVDSSRQSQYRTLLAVDRAVGDIVQALRETGRLGNTMIVFASDNGLAWGEHRWDGKQTPYEESIRVPLVIRYPPLTRERRIAPQMALNIDLAPTFAALAGAPRPHVDGRSLLPLLEGSTAWRHDFLIEHEFDPRGTRIPSYCAVRTTHQLFVAYGTGEREFYDLRSDPFELENRADDPATFRAREVLRQRVHALCDPPPPHMLRP
jgi:N-acetylglucosamine-6-sulfatase